MTSLINIKLTTYKGYYVDVRDGIRCGVSFTYNLFDGKIINEFEYRVVPLQN